MKRPLKITVIGLAALAAMGGTWWNATQASSHREAPLISGDPLGTFKTLWGSIWHALVIWAALALPVCAILHTALKPVVAAAMVRLSAKTAAPNLSSHPVEPASNTEPRPGAPGDEISPPQR